MATVAIQRGHCFRTSGSTGTQGRLQNGTVKTEQQYVDRLAQMTETEMRRRGHKVYVLTADERVPGSDVFLAFHQDGSSSSRASGASVGYPASAASARYASVWKATYQLSGWRGGFRADNYTAGLRGYYGYRRSSAPVKVLMEHGFATNPNEQQWMWDHLLATARAHADALDTYLGNPKPTEENTVPQTYNNVPSPTMRVGSRGIQVEALQKLLAAFAAKGSVTSPGSVDGIFGEQTKRSVVSLQRLLKVTADGIYGPQTATALSSFVRFLDGIASQPAPAPAPAPSPTGTVEQRLAKLEAQVAQILKALPHAD